MRDQTCFQDWDTVVLKTTSLPPISKICKKINESKAYENEIIPQKKVSTELKIALQRARLSKKISQKQLSSMMCCQTSLINQYESGKAIPNNAFISKLEQKLGTKLPRIKKK